MADPLAGLEVYQVGGAVRDRLLGLPISDHDWVVVGASPDAMLARGFRAVGKDFPVFLHPVSGDEYALARTERKTAPGYAGFAFHASADVTLEEDLRRRDLTINAIARAPDGTLVDPFHGQRDLQAKVLRHVSAAFAEDPVRILRIARFSARFTDFSIAPETLALMRAMVDAGEVDALVAERVWQEVSRGLMEARPSRMIEALRACGALAKILPEVEALFGVPQPPEHHPEVDTGAHLLLVLDWTAATAQPLPVRVAALTHDLGKGTTPRAEWPSHHAHEARSVALTERLCERLRVPADCRDLAVIVAREHGNIHRAAELRAATLTTLLERIDVLRRPERLPLILAACEADFRGRPGFEARDFDAPHIVSRAAAAMRAVDAGAIARRLTADGEAAHIAERLHEARVNAVRGTLQNP